MKKLLLNAVVSIYYESNLIYEFPTPKEIDKYEITNIINNKLVQIVNQDVKYYLWGEIFKKINEFDSLVSNEWEGDYVMGQSETKNYMFDILVEEIKVKISYVIIPVRHIIKNKK